MVRFCLFVLTLTGLSVARAATAQTASNNSSKDSTATDFGAGYEIIMHRQEYDHDPPPPFGTGEGPIQMIQIYPLIIAPLTPDGKAFNAEVSEMAENWWYDSIRGQIAPAILNTDITLDCEPIGRPPPVDDGSQNRKMLPGIISAACESYLYPHGAAHGDGTYWGFNWIVKERRIVTPRDVFDVHSKWLETLSKAANAERAPDVPPSFPLQKLDFANTRHWVLTANGLGLIYSTREFSGFVEGGVGVLAVIPWSKLAPYLNPHGIVPQSDWNATLPTGN